MKGYKHLTLEERVVLFKGLRDGFSIREMANHLGRQPSTLSRELSRNGFEGIGYLPDTAQYKSSQRRTKGNKHPLKSPEIYQYVIAKLKKCWSPEQISNRIRMDMPKLSIHHETIYSFIYSKEAKYMKLYKYLRLARKRRRKLYGRKAQRVLIPCRTWITERPISANKRMEIGHWEADSMMFSKQKSALLVQVDRLTRYTLATKMKRKTSDAVKNIFLNKFSDWPEELKRTASVDNGSEFVKHLEITEALNMPVYFCHPYSSWEKGTVENTNGLIRQYLPRSTNMRKIHQWQIDKIINQLNNRPRKCLNYMTPKEVFTNCKGVALRN